MSTAVAAPTPTADQAAFLQAIDSGHSALLTGRAGTGKSVTLNLARTKYRTGLSVCATTGIAALNVGGCTIHSWAGLGLGDSSAKYLAHKIMTGGRSSNKVFDRIISCKRLALDEVSMCSADLLTKFDEVMRLVRKCDAPFGGIQMVFIGDFLQLPPVIKADPRQAEMDMDQDKPRFAFQSRSWREALVQIHELKTILRQKDIEFAEVLNKVRVGDVDDQVIQMLESRVRVKDENPEIKPVKLNGYNAAVDAINMMELDKLPGPDVLLPAVDEGIPAFVEQLKKNCIAPEMLTLRVGAQVMLLRNLDVNAGLVNGSLGIVKDFDSANQPVVEFANGLVEHLEPAVWELKSDGDVLARRTQIPLRLAWAWTIHKSQGQTLDKVEVDLKTAFEYGQAYVALSRCKTLEGLFLSGLDLSKIRADPQALEFYGYR